jgi:hypothetical protein
MLPLPSFVWQRLIRGRSRSIRASLGFMTEEHHLVREFAVREMPSVGEPLSPELIAKELDLPEERILTVLDDLEEHLTFVCRNEAGAVSWAYPVTAEPTPHHLTFSSGEKLYAA